MIKECMLAKAGILFDKDYLRDTLNFDLKTRSVIKDQDELRGIMQVGNVDEITLDGRTLPANEMPKWVLLSAFWEIVLAQWFWALLEYVPMSTAYQDHRGNWFRRREYEFPSLCFFQLTIVDIGLIADKADSFRFTRTKY